MRYLALCCDYDGTLATHGALLPDTVKALERLISRVRLLEGVLRTETLVVLSTQLERTLIPLGVKTDDPPPLKRGNGNGGAHKEIKLVEASEALEHGERSES